VAAGQGLGFDVFGRVLERENFFFFFCGYFLFIPKLLKKVLFSSLNC
jgi:hypothetical protein